MPEKLLAHDLFWSLPSNQVYSVVGALKNIPSFSSRFMQSRIFCSSSSRFSGRLSGFIFPAVYAQSITEHSVAKETSTGTAEINERLEDVAAALTTLDKLAMPRPRPKAIISDEEVLAYIDSEMPLDRLRSMFVKNSSGEYSQELQMIANLTMTSALMVGLVTSVLGGYAARDTFVRKHKHIKFETRFLAMRKYNDAILFGSLKMGMKWGLRTVIFTSLFMGTAQSISVYRNQTNIIEYIAAGAVTCSLLRFNNGPVAMLAGGVIGAMLGCVGGAAFCALLYMVDETQQKRHFWVVQQTLRDLREIKLLTETTDALPPGVSQEIT